MHPGSLSEFVGGYNGTCGQAALACAIAAVQDRHATDADILHITEWMIAHGEASPNGASTVTSLAQYCRDQGIAVWAEYPYPLTQDWQAIVNAYAGKMPIVVEVANGEALPGDEAGLHFHFICIWGGGPNDYWCSDGDKPDADHYLYPAWAIHDAEPCGILVLRRSPMTIQEFVASQPVLGPILKGPYPVPGRSGAEDGTQEALCQNGKALQFPDGTCAGGACGQQLIDTQAQLAQAQAAQGPFLAAVKTIIDAIKAM